MKDILPLLVALIVGGGAVYLARGNGHRSQDSDPELVAALAELRVEVQRLREQVAARPTLAPGPASPGTEGRHLTPNGPPPALREPDDPKPPPPPGVRVIPKLAGAEHVRRMHPEDPLPVRTEADEELLRTLSTNHDDEEEHQATLRAWMFVSEGEFLRRFGVPDSVRTDGGKEVWVYDNLFEREPGREVQLKFHKGRLIGVY